ncbi:hypothetical protein L195_g004000 [Trifolium pratense]|uniref:Uncharacterized protein n=1 Tax=Trifolium pratense TaxID=57577 RepID=A0A2K3NWU3_TRIPR|nr:hypothetical protein L195_g004000 [Trifolium pratense]
MWGCRFHHVGVAILLFAVDLHHADKVVILLLGLIVMPSSGLFRYCGMLYLVDVVPDWLSRSKTL